MKRLYKKSLYKIFVSLFIVLYSIVPQAIAMGEVINTLQEDYAVPIEEEIIPEESLLQEEIPLPEEEIPLVVEEPLVEEPIIEEPVVEETIVEEPVIEPEEVIKEVMSYPVWVINGDTATTSDIVELGKTYIAPQNSRVRIIFTKLPENPSTLTIEEITLTEEEVLATNAVSNIAYDITTDMIDGTFEYDLVLPFEGNDDTKIVYAEERGGLLIGVSEIPNEILEEKETVKVKGLDHFTIYIEVFRNSSMSISAEYFVLGGVIYIKASGLLKGVEHYYKIDIFKPDDVEPVSGSTCENKTSGPATWDKTFSYTLLPGDPIGSGWKTMVNEYTDSSCSTKPIGENFAEDTFEVLALDLTLEASCIEDAAGIGELNCTANDVTIADVVVTEITDGCTSSDDTATFEALWSVRSGANRRYDVGLYFPTEGQDSARNGSCSVTVLPNSLTDYWFNYDGDYCGDIDSSITLEKEITLTVACNDPDGDGYLNLPYCISWDNDANTTCSSPLDAIPGTTSKCNCSDGEGIEIPEIIVPFDAYIKVVKNLIPSSDLGRFDLQIDGVTGKEAAGDEGDTGFVKVSAGDSINSRDTHTVSEVAYSGTSLSDYTTSIQCLNNDTGSLVASSTNAGPLTVPVNPDDEIVCTITNKRNFIDVEIEVCKEDTEGNDIEGWKVYLNDNEQLTGANGCYTWTVTAPGTYTATEENRTGWTPTLPITHVFVVTSGMTKQSHTFVNFQNTDVLVCKENTEENPVENWNVYINDVGKQTGGDGCATFTITEPGDYEVREESRSGWTPIGDTSYNFTAVSGGSYGPYEFVNYQHARFSGYKLNDINGNGAESDASDQAIEGWGLSLQKYDENGKIWTTVGSTSTDVLGAWSFTITEPGKYRVQEESRSGWIPTNFVSGYYPSEAGMPMVSWSRIGNIKFLNFQLGTVTVCKYKDITGNGSIEDAGDILYDGGWDFYLDEDMQNATKGCYIWDDVGPGSHTITEGTKPGWIQTYPVEGSYSFDAVSGMNETYNFGNFKLASISGHKYNDVNGDGVKDSEDLPLENWIFELQKYVDGNWIVSETSTTNTLGEWSFSGIGPGKYRVHEVLQVGWIPTTWTSGYYNAEAGMTETSGSIITNVNFLNFQLGNITVCKYEDINGDGIKDEEDFPLSGINMELYKYIEEDWQYAETLATLEDGCTVFTKLEAGQYRVEEDYTDLDGYYSSNSILSHEVDILSGSDETIEFLNTKYRTISGQKYEDMNGNGIKEEGEPVLRDWIIFLDENLDGELNEGEEFTLTDDNGDYEFGDLEAGNYRVREEVKEGWIQTYPNDPNYHNIDLRTTYIGENIDFGNYKLATVRIYKDVTKEYKDEEREYITDQFFNVIFDGQSGIIKDFGEGSVYAEFSNLEPGGHSFNEINIPEGYNFWGCFPSDDESPEKGEIPELYRITLNSGEEATYICFNEVVKPELEITKLNDRGLSGIYVGDIVTYTIIVRAPNDGIDGTYYIKDVTVFDISPKGFEYISSSWTGTVLEPTYNGVPAVWYLEDMKEGDEITLTYKARVSETQDPGTYRDIVYTYGTSLLEGADGDVLGLGVYSGDASTNLVKTNFVGTEVLVIEDPELEEGEVLGASIELPATGAETYLTLGALISMILGFILLVFNPKKKIKTLFLTTILLLGVFTLVKPTEIFAVPNVEVQIEKPVSPTKEDTFKIGFVTLDLLGRDMKVQCYVNGVFFGPIYSTNSGNCEVTPTIITASGTYNFYVVATPDGGVSATSETVQVEIKLEKPLPITNYVKTEGTCKYTLTFKTANDGRTSEVEIFRSDTQPFTANASTWIKTLPVVPNADVSYTDTSITDCSKEYYYAIRALDDLGNFSSFVTDNIVTIVTTPGGNVATTVTTTSGETGEIAGEETTIEEEEGKEEINGEVKGEEEENGETEEEEEEIEKEAFLNKYKYILLALGFVVLGGVGYWYVRRKK